MRLFVPDCTVRETRVEHVNKLCLVADWWLARPALDAGYGRNDRRSHGLNPPPRFFSLFLLFFVPFFPPSKRKRLVQWPTKAVYVVLQCRHNFDIVSN